MLEDGPDLMDVPMPIRTPRLLIRPREPGDGKFALAAIRETWDACEDHPKQHPAYSGADTSGDECNCLR